MADEVDVFLRDFAPDDVRATVAWLLDHGYVLSGLRPATGLGTFGSSLVYSGEAELTVAVDRSQWYMDIAPASGTNPHNFELMLAVHSGRPYWECFPSAGQRDWRLPLPRQLPPGVAWRDTLPAVLAWLAGADDVAAAVALAQDLRFVVAWPESNKARTLRRIW